MANLRDIRRRIKSVKSTSQITKAMELVSAAKMKKAQDQALDDIGPDHRLDATHERVDRDEDSRGEDDALDAPAGDRMHADGDPQHDGSGTRDLREQVADNRIDTCPGTETFFQMVVGGDLTALAIKGDKPFRGDPSADGQGEAEDKEVPVVAEGLARVSDEGVAGKVGAEERKAYCPTGQSSACRHELIGGTAAFGEPAAKAHHGGEVDKQDEAVDGGVHS